MLLTVKDAANLLNCSESHVYALMAEGRLKHYVIGKGRGGKRVSREQIDAFLKESEVEPQIPTPLRDITFRSSVPS